MQLCNESTAFSEVGINTCTGVMFSISGPRKAISFVAEEFLYRFKQLNKLYLNTHVLSGHGTYNKSIMPAE